MINSKYELAKQIADNLNDADLLNLIDRDLLTAKQDTIDIIMHSLRDLIVIQGNVMPDKED